MVDSPRPATDAVPAPIPVTFLITDLDDGGAERALVEILKRLDRTHWDPRVLCLAPKGDLVEAIQNLGIPVECYGARRFWSLPGAVWWATRRLRNSRVQVLQCFLFHANFVGRLAGRLAGIRVILAGHRVAEREQRWHLILEKWTGRLVDHHVCVSRGVAEHLQQATGTRSDRISIIPNGVLPALPVAVDLTQRFGIPPGRKVVLAAGRLHRQKGFDLLLDAFSLVALEDPLSHLLILGDGSERPRLEAKIRELKLETQVTMPGRQPDLSGIMSSCTVFALSSRWEGMPNVVLEAMSAGLPVVSAPVEGIAELLEDGVSGLVTSPFETKDFADRIARLLNDTKLASEISEASQHYVHKYFTWDNVVQDYQQLFVRLLSVRRK